MSLLSYALSIFPFRKHRARVAGRSQADQRLPRLIRAAAADLRRLTVADLKSRVEELRRDARRRSWKPGSERIRGIESLVQTFALVEESAHRVLGLSYYDEQFLAAQGLVRGAIVEMATGEGKTLVQALAAFVGALPGKGVHVMTSNAYLAERDYQQLAPIFEQLGLSVGVLVPGSSPADKRRAYLADITYGPGYEFGFDYLRDQLGVQRQRRSVLGDALRRRLRNEEQKKTEMLQRGHAVAIVDEADSVLIDEATTPLLLSSAPASSTEGNTAAYYHAARVAQRLEAGTDFTLDERQRLAQLTPCGMETILRPENLPKNCILERAWPVYIEQALVARYLLCRDVDYVVDQQRVALVDQDTGRIFTDRSFWQGLHQAVEAQEQLPITATRQTLARMSRQQYFRLYSTLSGMTGTARGSDRELAAIYQLKVVVIPTRKASQRIVLPSRFFATKQAKHNAIIKEIRERHATGQPILVGTRTIEESRQLAVLLADAVPAQLLNGTQDIAESDIIAQAGQRSAITIATNLAGRGTDIRLGAGVASLGGLHVIVVEPHTASRVDRQLVGRAARQGDPGSCQLFVSAEDDLLRVFAPRLSQKMAHWANAHGEVHRNLSTEVARIQRRVERLNYEKRRRLVQRDAWMENVLAKLTGHDERE